MSRNYWTVKEEADYFGKSYEEVCQDREDAADAEFDRRRDDDLLEQYKETP